MLLISPGGEGADSSKGGMCYVTPMAPHHPGVSWPC